MIKKEHRLTKKRHYQFIYRKGKAEHSKFLTLVYARTKIQPFKVGFSISKKIGKSVVRNKVKRRMRESFNILENIFNINYNYVFVAKKGIENLNFWEIKTDMERLIKRINNK
ncbi:MAG: ribonuclease P protein component [Clostridia bacterium]|nr:ribonuclease P protein component [Clostridia bacterium]MDD4685839.1 ribonuclease P protein component [Clostridia bacterium]